MQEGDDGWEAEEGDKEVFDEGQVLDELGRVHMKTILDQDQRDVRLIQELFLEDGDLHSDGGGRQRQFRWKNAVDGQQIELGPRTTQQEAEDAEADDDQEDSTWRKMRSDREKWLQEQKKNQQQQVLNCVKRLIFFIEFELNLVISTGDGVGYSAGHEPQRENGQSEQQKS